MKGNRNQKVILSKTFGDKDFIRVPDKTSVKYRDY